LTLRSSQAQPRPAWRPAARANPVMLAMGKKAVSWRAPRGAGRYLSAGGHSILASRTQQPAADAATAPFHPRREPRQPGRRMQPRSILITGASSGLGAALAASYAGPGVTLHLGGRDRRRLSLVADRCRLMGARAVPAAVDVTDQAAMAAWVRAADALAPLDLVIANAGVSTVTLGTGDDGPALTRRVFAINVDGVLNTVLPALERLRARPLPPVPRRWPARQGWRGQIAIVSSLAGMRGMPGAPAYSASKAAEKAWGEALAVRLASERIAVSVVLPGFVDTPMTRGNYFRMPMLWPVDRAVRVIRRGLARRRRRIAFPWPLYLGAWFLSVLPVAIADRILARAPTKSDA